MFSAAAAPFYILTNKHGFLQLFENIYNSYLEFFVKPDIWSLSQAVLLLAIFLVCGPKFLVSMHVLYIFFVVVGNRTSQLWQRFWPPLRISFRRSWFQMCSYLSPSLVLAGETSPVYGSPPSSDESTSLQAVLQVNLVLSRQVSEVFLLQSVSLLGQDL